jgi:hypothetical protein
MAVKVRLDRGASINFRTHVRNRETYMKIQIRYSTSEGPHFLELSIGQLESISEDDELEFREPTPKGDKRLSIDGNPQELMALANVIMNRAVALTKDN